MKTSTKAFLIWSTLCVALAALALWKLPNVKWEYPGKDIIFVTSDSNQFVTAKSATIEAASNSYFLIRNKKTSEVVSGVPKPKPLGWISDEYYTAGPVSLTNGIWIVEKGSMITVHLYAESDINTVESKDDESRGWAVFWLFILAVVVWFIGCAIGSDIEWD